MKTYAWCTALRSTAIVPWIFLSACGNAGLSPSTTSLDNDASDGQSENEKPALGLQIPRVILSSRAIDLSQVTPTVTLGNGTSIAMTKNNNTDTDSQTSTQWTGSISVAANSQQTLEISWFERYRNVDLLLAELTRVVSVGDSGLNVTLGPGDYSTNIDTDNDGSTNLDERNRDSNPLDPNSRPSSMPTPSNQINVRIPKIDPSNAPTIDGLGAAYNATELKLVGEWQAAAQEGTLAGSGLFIDSLMIDKGNTNVESNPFHRWAAMHDGTYLYLLVLVDDLSVNQSDSPEMNEDDAIEIYIDGNNSNLDKYGDADDRYFILPLQQFNSPAANASANANSRIERGVTSAPLPTDIEWATGLATGPLSLRNPAERHDVYEVKVSLDSIGINVGNPFGIEIQINDDDDGGARDSKWGWIHPSRTDTDTDLTWQNPSFMATGALDP